MSSDKESRRHPRVQVILKVAYSSHRDFLADYSSNASESGLFIATHNTFEVGEMIEFDISFPGLLESIRCKAEVCWYRPPEEELDHTPAGMGVSFVFDTTEQEQKIRALVEGLSAQEQNEELAPKEGDEPFKVLLVEDNPLVREMLRFAMRKFHRMKHPEKQLLGLVEADNGQEAIEKLNQQSFSIAIIDYYMPVMDGGQLLNHIRTDKDHADLPVIMVSAGGEEARTAAYAAGANLFLAKPLVLNQLFESLHKLLVMR